MGKLPASALSALAFALAVPIVVAILFFPVMLLAGPHSDLLPHFLQGGVVVAAWVSVVAIPVWLARLTYLRLRR